MAEIIAQQNETKEGTGLVTSGAQQAYATLNPVLALSESRESDPLRVASNAQGRTETASLATSPSISGTSTLVNLSGTSDSLDITLEDNVSNSSAQNARLEEVRTTPLFAADVLRVSADAAVSTVPFNTLSQYALLADIKDVRGRGPEKPQYVHDESKDNRLFLNTNPPWSAFICGSQRSGKSYTLSCMLEGAMLQSEAPYTLGKLQHPLASIVFHYDKFNQACEAAYLCSTGIPVKVLVSPVSFGKLHRLYSNLPNVPKHLRPTVRPLAFEQHHLSAMSGLFHKRAKAKDRQAAIWRVDKWSSKPGSLTIVDLSCPSVDEVTACELFEECLSIFVQDRNLGGRIVALDQAHKFINDAEGASSSFTQSLLSVISQQRHLATRVIIATQEPTISPNLLGLCSMTIVHRFNSPSSLQALRTHLAGVSMLHDDGQTLDIKQIFRNIANLEAGEALLFSPSMILSISEGSTPGGARVLQTEKLGMGYIKMRVRKRVSADGGRSILAA